MHIPNLPAIRACRPAWNKGRVVGQNRPLLPKHVWAIRVRLEIAGNFRDLLCSIWPSTVNCATVIWSSLWWPMFMPQVRSGQRANINHSEQDTKPVRDEITEGTCKSLLRWMEEPLMVSSKYLWPGRFHERLHISTRQYARLVRETAIGLCRNE